MNTSKNCLVRRAWYGPRRPPRYLGKSSNGSPGWFVDRRRAMRFTWAVAHEVKKLFARSSVVKLVVKNAIEPAKE